MAKFLIIGPSGIGKSTALESLSKHGDLEIYDLDKLLEKESNGMGLTKYVGEIGWGGFFDKSKEIIESLESDKKNIIIAVGAGSFEHIPGHDWYSKQNTISLVGDPKKIYPRCGRQEFHPTLESYSCVEYSAWRTKLYNSTKFKIDVAELNKDKVAEEILKIIKNN